MASGNIIRPPALKPGDTIGVMAPSSYVEPQGIADDIAWLESKGYRIIVHPQTFARQYQSAGTAEEKAAALHDLAQNDEVKAVIFASGGNRALHVLEHVNFDLIQSRPKIYMGFSDATALLNGISARTGLVTYHGPILRRLGAHPQRDFALGLLEGREDTIDMEKTVIVTPGQAQGKLYGGNLAVFRALVGSGDLPDMTGAILFLEDINEETSRIDRDLCVLRRAGIFQKINGLVCGQFLKTQDTGTRPFGFTLQDIVAEHTDGLDIPVLMNAPFGHGDQLYALPVGGMARLDGKSLTLFS